MPRSRRTVVVLGASVVAVVAAVTLGLALTGGPAAIRPGAPIPVSGRLPRIEGRTVQGDRYVPTSDRGHVVVLNFWNEYCAPCRREQPQLELSWERMRGKLPVAFVGVNYVGQSWPDDQAAARRYLRVFAVSYPSVLDPSLRLAHEIGLSGIPATYVADARGRLRFEILGAVRPFELDRLVRRVLRR